MKGKILLLAIPLLFSCAKSNEQGKDPKIKPHSYEEVKEKMINWADNLKNEGMYCIYYFSRTCPLCESIRDEVIEISLTHQTPVYFCNDNMIAVDPYIINDIESTIGCSDINEFRIAGFPSIIKVNEHQVVEHHPGRKETLNFIRSIA